MANSLDILCIFLNVVYISQKQNVQKMSPHYQGKNFGAKLVLLLTWGFKKTIRDHVVKIHSHTNTYSNNRYMLVLLLHTNITAKTCGILNKSTSV